ncbi:MAG: GTP-binding protein [Candidatus Kerfeldbacteria bacterium]|nr:GTP-binding protein [Candidatus Kerfeldbacteria bacterium]
MSHIPVTVFTGYLGSGKTTIIMNLIRQMPKRYSMVLLKNEFGDVAVDSQLAQESNIAVTEMLNGCLCCVLVGKMGNAIDELLTTYNPDRIIIETSGSAYPAPIALEIRKMEDRLHLDSIVTVIDAINFEGYADKSYTAKIQAQYTDLILINKHESVDERTLDQTLDDVYELNPNTPKVKTDHGVVSPDLIFGLDTKLFASQLEIDAAEQGRNTHHHDQEVEIATVVTDILLERRNVDAMLTKLPKTEFYRIKGMVRFADGPYLLNYVFGRFDYTPLSHYTEKTQITFMGEGLGAYDDDIIQGLGIPRQDLTIHAGNDAK